MPCEDANWNLFYVENILAGDVDMALRFDLLNFHSDTGIALPTSVFTTVADMGWTWRFLNQNSLQFRIAPGLYGDSSASFSDLFSIPAQVSIFRAFSPTLSGQLGVEVRADWDLPVMPLLGLTWQPSDLFRLEAMLPKSRILFNFYDNVILYGTLEWRNLSYALDSGDGTPSQFTMDDFLATAGLLFAITPELHVGVEGGTFLSRTLRADTAADSSIDLSNAPFGRISISGAF